MLLKDRVAIITGGSVGMGRSTALKFAEEGCSVVVADVNDAEGKKTIETVSQKGKEGLYIHCDVTDTRQVQDLISKVISKFGKIDIMDNNAGGILGQPSGIIEEITDERWQKIIDLNLKSAFLCCRAVVPHMKEKKYGKIINLSSMGAVDPPGAGADYNTAKAGILGLTYDLALELAPFNIYVNAIVPGPIRTPFWDPLVKAVPDADALFAAVAKNEVPLGRMGTPEEIANSALFLASDLSSYVTGQALYVAGGQPLSPTTMPM
jgi:NAD(P)-dependent dehydrogenase (short-subunit alcohol dehydrogenase family)